MKWDWLVQLTKKGKYDMQTKKCYTILIINSLLMHIKTKNSHSPWYI